MLQRLCWEIPNNKLLFIWVMKLTLIKVIKFWLICLNKTRLWVEGKTILLIKYIITINKSLRPWLPNIKEIIHLKTIYWVWIPDRKKYLIIKCSNRINNLKSYNTHNLREHVQKILTIKQFKKMRFFKNKMILFHLQALIKTRLILHWIFVVLIRKR